MFDRLRRLLERRGQMVIKAELLDAVWAGEHENEGAVPWTVFHARRVLGQGRGAKLPIACSRFVYGPVPHPSDAASFGFRLASN